MAADPQKQPDPSPPSPQMPGLLARLRLAARSRSIPYVQQLTAADCGPACLAMVLAYHGKEVRLDAVRDVTGTGRDGSGAVAILNTARWFGLRGRGVALEVDDLEYLEPGSILHWEFNHFVVFERLGKDWVDVVDPAGGRRRIPMAEFRRAFTGVALLFEPGDGFLEETRRDKPVRRYAKQVLADTSHWSRVVVTSILLQIFALALPILTGAVVDRVVPRSDHHLLIVVTSGMMALVVFHFLASMIRAHLLLHLRTYLDARMTVGFLEHMMELPYAYFQRRLAGDLMMRMSSNTTIREILTSGVLSGVIDGALVFAYLGILAVMSGGMALVVIGLAVLHILVFLVLRKRQAELMAVGLVTQARAQGYQFELLNGVETLKAMGSEQRAVEKWTDLFVDTLNVSLDRGRLDALATSLTGTLRLASPLVILAFGAQQVMSGHLTLGTMLGLSALAGGFLGPLGNLVSTAMQLQLLGSYVARIDDVLETPPEQDRAKVRLAPALAGRLAVERVSFRYAPTAPLVVKDVSVDVAPGAFVAIVGKSGSGKSTMASLMAGLYRPDEGRILFDGLDAAELEARSVRRQLGIVVQRPYLFGGSLRSNIALADPSAPLDAVVEAAKRACLHDEIVAMPMGYETILVDGGASLSGGQRQRVALARALVRKPVVLLLDEATSALDAITEVAVQRELAALGCTRIVIAHRLSTIAGADLILVMDGGAIVERGTHAELLARRGAYAHLLAAQVDR